MPGFAINNTSSDFSIDHKAEFHRSHRWRIEDLGPPANLGIKDFHKLRLYAKTLELPSLTFEDEKVDGASIKYKFPKRALWDNVTVSFYDVYGLYSILRKWQQAIWSPGTGLNLVNDFKGSAKFILTDGFGLEEKQIYTLVGCYPTKITHSELSAASSEIKLLTVVYAFDYATIKINDVTPRIFPPRRSAPRVSLPSGPAPQSVQPLT